MELNLRFVTVLLLVSVLSVALVLGATLLSVGLVVAVKSSFNFLLRFLSVVTEILVALVAGLTSGATVTLSVLVAAGSSALVIPASLLELRIATSATISATSIMLAASMIFYVTAPVINMELGVALISAAGLAVACASVWAVGVMSLIERETHQVGLKMTSILDAVHNNKRFMLRLLVKLHSGFKSRDHDLDLALLHAVKAGYFDCAEILLGAGARGDVSDGHGNTSLMHACQIGNEDIVRLLIDVGCDVNQCSLIRDTALHHAAKWGFIDCIEELLKNGAKVDVQDLQGRTPLMLAVTHASNADAVIKLLVDAGADVNIMGFEGRRVIHYAARRGLDVQQIISAGADLDMRDEEGNQALHYGASEGHSRVIKMLLDYGADPNTCNFSGKSPIQFASTSGHVQCIKTLIEGKADVSILDETGKSALCYATENEHLMAVIFLLKQSSPSYKTNTRNLHPNVHPPDPVNIALEKRFVNIVKALVIAGYSCTALFDWLNHTPEELWVEGKIEHISWLRDFLSNPSSLSHLSRLVIREKLMNDIPQKIKLLPLPTKLKEYLLFEDLSELVIMKGLNDSIGMLT